VEEIRQFQGGRTGPALGEAQHDHRPQGAHRVAAAAGLGTDHKDAVDGLIHGGGHGPVHRQGIVAFHHDRLPAVAAQQADQLLLGDARLQGGIVDLVAMFDTLMNGSGGFRGAVAADVAGEGELLEEPLHAVPILGLVRINHAHRQVVGGTPPSIKAGELLLLVHGAAVFAVTGRRVRRVSSEGTSRAN